MENSEWVKTPDGKTVVEAMIRCNHEYVTDYSTEQEDMAAILLAALDTGLIFTTQTKTVEIVKRTGRYG